MSASSLATLCVFLVSLVACVLLEIFTKAGAGFVWIFPAFSFFGIINKE